MNGSAARPTHREELLARCRRERAELAGATGAAVSRLHRTRDLLRTLRTIRSVFRFLQRGAAAAAQSSRDR
jgi:hypothetical protein